MFFLITTTYKVTYSKYANRLNDDFSVSTALFANDVSLLVTNPQSLYPGSEAVVVPVRVTNYSDLKVCEVDEEYMIKIDKDFSNIPLEYSLCMDSECNHVLVPNQEGYYTDDTFSFLANQASENVFYLRVYWPLEYNDSNYAFEIDYIKLNFIIKQIN